MIRKIILNILTLLLNKLSNKSQIEGLIKILAKDKAINLMLLAYRDIGIHNPGFELGGEKHLIEVFLKKKLNAKNNLVLFDVGANVGKYSIQLSKNFPMAKIYAFEPTRSTFDILCRNTMEINNIKSFNIGFGNKQETKTLYINKEAESSVHNSLYEAAVSEFLKYDEVSEEEIEVNTIDLFCNERGIKKIDFLKIDTEGHEYLVLEGAINLIKGKKISIIQFEFNEMNIIARKFLRDFYNLLNNYSFFRLQKNNLLSLGNYDSFNEIFRYQNIVAIRNDS